MDDHKKQSIKFDIQELEKKLADVEKEIEFLKEQLKHVEKGTVGVGIFGMGMATFFAKQAFRKTPMGRAAALGAILTGAKSGYELADRALELERTKIIVLEQERDRLKK